MKTEIALLIAGPVLLWVVPVWASPLAVIPMLVALMMQERRHRAAREERS